MATVTVTSAVKPKKAKRDLVADAAYGEYGRGQIEILTPEGVTLSFGEASIAERAGALVLDFLIMYLVPAIVFLVVALSFGPFISDFAKAHKTAASILIIFFLFAAFFLRSGYFIVFEMGRHAATPGKRLLKLRVIAHDGGRLTPAAVFTRNALREVELYLPLGLMMQSLAAGSAYGWLAFFWALGLLFLPVFNKQHARLGDFLAGTRVIHMPKAALSYDLADLEGDQALGLHFTPEQLAYGEKELTVLEQVLRDRKPDVMKAVADKIKLRIGWIEPFDPPGNETFLRAYYGALRAHLEARMLLGRRRKDKHATPV